MSATDELTAINAKRDLLTKIVADYVANQTALKAETDAADARLDGALATESAQAVSLAGVQKQLDGLSLQADLTRLEATQAALLTKAASFGSLVAANNATAATIFDAVKASQDMVDLVSATIADIRANLAAIHSAIDLATSPAVAVAVAADL